jgi:general stress protein 26
MSDRKSHDVLWDLIKDTRFCMLAHRHTDGTLHSHPLTTQNKALDEGRSLYFFVSRSSEVGQRLQQDGNVNLAYANPDKDTWVSITGTARVLEDAAKKRELFNPIAKAWFPNGPDDPDMELVEVVIARRRWASTRNCTSADWARARAAARYLRTLIDCR